MPVTAATEADFPAVAALVNSAYRGESAKQGWTHEADMIGGDRITVARLHEALAKPDVHLLLLREDGGLCGCVVVERMQGEIWYLGMLTVRPDLQGAGAGRRLVSAAEDQARSNGAAAMHMTVITIRDSLIAWYERLGYSDSGDRLPYDYGGELRTGLEFAVLQKAL